MAAGGIVLRCSGITPSQVVWADWAVFLNPLEGTSQSLIGAGICACNCRAKWLITVVTSWAQDRFDARRLALGGWLSHPRLVALAGMVIPLFLMRYKLKHVSKAGES
jgi:hypothetical protein